MYSSRVLLMKTLWAMESISVSMLGFCPETVKSLSSKMRLKYWFRRVTNTSSTDAKWLKMVRRETPGAFGERFGVQRAVAAFKNEGFCSFDNCDAILRFAAERLSACLRGIQRVLP